VNALPGLKNGKKQTFWMSKDHVPKTAIEFAVKRLAKFANLSSENAGIHMNGLNNNICNS
jgi:hypothetical protein